MNRDFKKKLYEEAAKPFQLTDDDYKEFKKLAIKLSKKVPNNWRELLCKTNENLND